MQSPPRSVCRACKNCSSKPSRIFLQKWSVRLQAAFCLSSSHRFCGASAFTATKCSTPWRSAYSKTFYPHTSCPKRSSTHSCTSAAQAQRSRSSSRFFSLPKRAVPSGSQNFRLHPRFSTSVSRWFSGFRYSAIRFCSCRSSSCPKPAIRSRIFYQKPIFCQPYSTKSTGQRPFS